ncbi:MAG: carbamoyltransferase HypF [Lentisphaeria bacterium]|nr:carbamoyltransferase HypF [Lentisphaeria bacterium]
MKNSVILELHGAVHQGGARAFFWKLAAEAGLTGWIANSNQGVYLRIEGTDEQISSFIRLLPVRVPGAFRLRSIRVIKRENRIPDTQCQPIFRVLDQTEKIPEIPPDRAACSACTGEALDPASRRYGYAFFCCGNCGPRYSFALRSPFSRKNSYMTAFPMCPDCRAENDHEADPHHHNAELLACAHCGPQFFLLDMYGNLVPDDNPLCAGRKALKSGEILAVQSLYGDFQLFADAFNPDTILRLRKKRKLSSRPLCLMARNLETVRRYCECSRLESQLLLSPSSPVLILNKKPGAVLPKIISPDTDTLAVGLPFSLPEKLLFEFQDRADSPPPFELLVTCGHNRSGKAECLDFDKIFNRLMKFTDKLLCHDLKSDFVCPPSVCQVHRKQVFFLRRARGYVPRGIELSGRLCRNIGAFGCDARAAVAIGLRNRIIPSQSLGRIDREPETAVLKNMFEHFTSLFDQVPEIMACDMNRDSFSARACGAFADLHGLSLVTVQTHHAHALACMAEHGLKRSLALVMNGGSPGPDGTEWGSECLDARMDGFSRLAAFKSVPLNKGQPAQLFLDYLTANQVKPFPELLERLGVDDMEYEFWKKQQTFQSGWSHSAFRLVNAICAGLGIISDFCTYPDRCLLLLGKYAARFDRTGRVPDSIAAQFQFRMTGENDFQLVDWSDTILNLARLPSVSEEEKVFYAEAFCNAFADSMLAMSRFAQSRSGIRDIVLSGSLFQNPILLEKTCARLKAGSFRVFTHLQLPCDESCVPAGQIYAAGLMEKT